MNLSEKSLAASLRSAGFKSAFAFDDGIALDSEDVQRILHELNKKNIGTKLIDYSSKASADSPTESEAIDASSFNF